MRKICFAVLSLLFSSAVFAASISVFVPWNCLSGITCSATCGESGTWNCSLSGNPSSGVITVYGTKGTFVNVSVPTNAVNVSVSPQAVFGFCNGENSCSLSSSGGNYSWSSGPWCSGSGGAFIGFFCLVSFDVETPFYLPCDNPATAADSIACNIGYCVPTPTAAQAIITYRQAECENSGKYYFGEVVQENGNYCIEDGCSTLGCPADNPVLPVLKKSIATEKSSEDFPREASYDDYNNVFRGKPALYYDALGRRTEPRPETRRHLFTPRDAKSAVREIEPARAGFLKRESLTGQCCVESFSVGLADEEMTINNDKVGIEVNFNANFITEADSSGCNPSCCDFRQEARGKVSKNGEPKTGTSCVIGTRKIYLDSAEYVRDCYGRYCTLPDSREDYNDTLGTFAGWDRPGLKNINDGDTVNVLMEFNSYIKDRCNSNAIRSSLYWGFHIHGVTPAGLDTTFLGRINQ